jgi:hypothetical protein
MLIHFYKLIESFKSNPAKRDKLIIVAISIGIFINILIWLLIYLKLKPAIIHSGKIDAYIPLHYNIYIGIDSYGNWRKVFYLPGIGLLFIIINSILAFYLYNKKKILSYFFSITTPFLQFLLLVSLILIVLINI